MYLRFTQRSNADGTLVRYVALAHNQRVDGKVKPDVLLNLGRVDRLDIGGLRRLADSINKHFGDGDSITDATEAGLAAGTSPMEVIDSRPIGAAWLLDGLWKQLQIDQSLRTIADGRRFTTNVERVLFAGRQPGDRADEQAWGGRVGMPGRHHPGPWRHGRRPGVPGDGSAGGGRRAGPGAAGGVLRGRAPAQPGGGPAVLRHHLHLLRTRRGGGCRG